MAVFISTALSSVAQASSVIILEKVAATDINGGTISGYLKYDATNNITVGEDLTIYDPLTSTTYTATGTNVNGYFSYGVQSWSDSTHSVAFQLFADYGTLPSSGSITINANSYDAYPNGVDTNLPRFTVTGTITRVPEPGSIALLAAGIVGFAVSRRKAKN
jgi:hypothetical protein